MLILEDRNKFKKRGVSLPQHNIMGNLNNVKHFRAELFIDCRNNSLGQL